MSTPTGTRTILVDLDRVHARAKVLARADRELKDELIEARRNLDMTQADVAELLGVTPQAIQKFERYDNDPKLSTLRRYANAVGVIVEHRVTTDIGQSLLMAAPTPWSEIYSEVVTKTSLPARQVRTPRPSYEDAPRRAFSLAC